MPRFVVVVMDERLIIYRVIAVFVVLRLRDRVWMRVVCIKQFPHVRLVRQIPIERISVRRRAWSLVILDRTEIRARHAVEFVGAGAAAGAGGGETNSVEVDHGRHQVAAVGVVSERLRKLVGIQAGQADAGGQQEAVGIGQYLYRGRLLLDGAGLGGRRVKHGRTRAS